MSNRETKCERDLMKGAKRLGLSIVFERRSKHLLARVRRDGKVGSTCLSKTPGDGNVLKIALGKLKRTLI